VREDISASQERSEAVTNESHVLPSGRASCTVCGRSRQAARQLAGQQQRQLVAICRGRLAYSGETSGSVVCSSCLADIDAVSRKLADIEAKLDRRDLGRVRGIWS
jgi:hypothetical protein